MVRNTQKLLNSIRNRMYQYVYVLRDRSSLYRKYPHTSRNIYSAHQQTYLQTA